MGSGTMTGVGPSPERVQTGCWIAGQEVVTHSDDNLAITGLMLAPSARTTCPSAPSLPARQTMSALPPAVWQPWCLVLRSPSLTCEARLSGLLPRGNSRQNTQHCETFIWTPYPPQVPHHTPWSWDGVGWGLCISSDHFNAKSDPKLPSSRTETLGSTLIFKQIAFQSGSWPTSTLAVPWTLPT